MRDQVTPQPILELTTGVMAAQHLFTANEVGLFEQLGEETLGAEELAERTRLPVRAVRVLSNAMAARGLLEREGRKYRNGPAASAYLSGRTPETDLRPYVRMHKLLYSGWTEYENAIRAGGGTHAHLFRGADEDAQRTMLAGMEAMTGLGASTLPELLDFGASQHVLHVGGGTGLHMQAVLERYPRLRGTLVEMPPMVHRARQRLAPLVEEERLEIVERNPFQDDVPTGADVVLLAHLPHRLTPEANQALFERIRESVEPGAKLLLLDFWVSDEHTRPVPAVMAAGEFYMTLGGDVYSTDEVQDWLAKTGWSFRAHRDIDGTESLIEAEAA